MSKICIVGTTSWGMTLALVMARKGLTTHLWARTEEEAEHLRLKGPDSLQLPNITFPGNLKITSSLPEALKQSNAIILAVPSQCMRQNARLLQNGLSSYRLLISAAKGFETGSNKRMSQVIADEIAPDFHRNICALSGPNLALEIAQGMPAAAVVANTDKTIAQRAQKLLDAPGFSVYTNHDVTGVELGGALKNIIALGAGMIDGLGYGDNAKAAFITRGLTEMSAFAMALGANPLTLSGLAGLGDVIATCSSRLSRNHFVGEELTRGRSLKDIISGMAGVAEGVTTTQAVWEQSQKLKLEMPITHGIYQVLYKDGNARQIIASTLGSTLKHELAGRKWGFSSFFKLARWRK
jgi:glycerol-3-phosphate dehydrogenase (NAD(P)+)